MLGLLFLSLLPAVSGCKEAPGAVENYDYRLMTLEPGDRLLTERYSAAVNGRQDIAVYPQISGLLTELRVNEGDRVQAGQTLFVIDQVPYLAAVKTARANVAVAEASVSTARLTYESKQSLYEKKVVSAFDLQTAENALLSAEAQLAQMQAQLVNAENNLSYTVIKSPSDGVVGTLPYRVGSLVSPSLPQPLTTVSDNSLMYVYFSMTENNLLSLIRRYGSKDKALASLPEVSLLLNDRSEYPAKGRIASISGVIDRSTGSASVRAEFSNPDGILHSGASATVVLPYTRENVLVIPQAATFEIQDKVYAYRVTDGIANSVIIEVTPVNGGKEYIVESGLNPGDVIVAEGAGLLREGTRVVAPAAGRQN